MMAYQHFEFRIFPADEWGGMKSEDEFTVTESLRDVSAARSRAGRLSKRHNGPVDLAHAYEPGGVGQDWSNRYITTAAPSDYHASGFRFERLAA